MEENLFETKKEFIDSFYNIMRPLEKYYVDELPGLLSLGGSGSVYPKKTQEVEAFLRPLWAIGPFLSCQEDEALQKKYLKGIIAGTDPTSDSYWGTPNDYDQLLVEMAALSNTLLLAKEKFWDVLTEQEKDNLYNWLNYINKRDMPKNNWLFFRILVNLAFKKCGREWNREQVESDLEIIETFYINNGWYYDGEDSQIDYYVSFAIHYYSLIYCKEMSEETPLKVQVMKERAIKFAETFKYWFSETGEALPFGRSLTYRFAEVSFWSALVYADVEALPWGEIKGIISRHMRLWMTRDIFSTDGRLTIGYHYENLVMAEGYNAPGSPYWAMKTFILLGVDDEHPFWKSNVKQIDYDQEQLVIPEARMLVTKSKNQIQSFVAGQLERKQAHVDAKYSKLVYSTIFGFSVSKGSVYYKQGGFDSCLALSEDDKYFRTKLETKEYKIEKDRIINKWVPWEDVEVITTIIPFGEWHIRIHDIKTNRQLNLKEGGFSIPADSENTVSLNIEECIISCESKVGTTVIKGVQGWSNPELVITEPNTNLFFPKNTYPKLDATLNRGCHRLISLVGGICKESNMQVPELEYTHDKVLITINNKKINVKKRPGSLI